MRAVLVVVANILRQETFQLTAIWTVGSWDVAIRLLSGASAAAAPSFRDDGISDTTGL